MMTIFFVAFYVCGSAMSLFRHPIFGLVTYVGVFYLNPPERWWGQGALLGVRWALFSAAIMVVSVFLAKRREPVQKNADRGFIFGFGVLIAWVAVQSLWALDPPYHAELLEYWLKFLIILVLIPRIIETEQHLRLMLWAHVAGCFYLGLVVWTSYDGGRFEDFGASGISEANVGGLQIVTGLLAGGALFLSESNKFKIPVIVMMPFILNALVATVSRSAFLALLIAGVVFLSISPSKFRKRIILLACLAGVVFFSLTNSEYWNRMDTIKYAGSQVENVDTGGGRLEIMTAQWQMFLEYPLGCGHRCTAFLSRKYLDDRHLTGVGDERGRSSHNTYMTLLVEQGMFGILAYLMMALWIRKSVSKIVHAVSESQLFLRCATAGVAGALLAVTIGDFFVSHTRLEVRFWLLGCLIAILKLAKVDAVEPSASANAQRAAIRG